MPTLPTNALFDKDLSLRSPFPQHVTAAVPHNHLIRPNHTDRGARIAHARTDYSQIKRPTPVKPRHSPSVFDLQLPQSDSRTSIFLTVQKSQPSHRWTIADKELDRMYLASPMPKIIDQTYYSLTTAPQRLPTHSPSIPQLIPKRNISNILDLTIPNAGSGVSESAGNMQNKGVNKLSCHETPLSPPATIDNFTDEQPEEGILESRTSAAVIESSDALAPPSDNFNDANRDISVPKTISRKRRKSRYKSTQVGFNPPKQLEPLPKRRRLYRNTKEIEPNLKSDSQQQGFRVMNEEISPSTDDREKDDTRQEHTKPKSRISRIRSSVGQFFRGSFWDPPESTKRIRKPPSSWWTPSGPLKKRKRKSKVTIEDVDIQEDQSSAIKELSDGERLGDQGEHTLGVRRITTCQIYDFSD